MITTPAEFRERSGSKFPARQESLYRYRWHTGADLSPLPDDEPLPTLVRDIGPVGMEIFLGNRLNRLAGPMTPLTWMRTRHYTEPYTDYANIGRLVLLDPLQINPWHSGLPNIYVAKAGQMAELSTLAFYPSHLDLQNLPEEPATVDEFREALGSGDYDDIVEDTLSRVANLNEESASLEKVTGPVRRAFQSGDAETLKFLHQNELTESDLCTAWHHLPEHRRDHIKLIFG